MIPDRVASDGVYSTSIDGQVAIPSPSIAGPVAIPDGAVSRVLLEGSP